MTADDYMKCR